LKAKHRTLKSVENALSFLISAGGLAVLFISLIGNSWIFHQYSSYKKMQLEKDLASALAIYNLNLIGQLSAIASGTEFLEFIRSGKITRNHIVKDFAEAMNRFPRQEITGIAITNQSGELIFFSGQRSDNTVTTPLCYAGDTLNRKYGVCAATLTAYLSINQILHKLRDINPQIIPCMKCQPILHFPKQEINTALELESSVNFRMEIKSDSDHVYLGGASTFSLFMLAVFSLWTRQKVKSTMEHEIIQPIVGLSSVLDSNTIKLSTVQEIIDLKYQKELLRIRTLAEQTQNKRLANDLHDLFAALLLQLKWGLEKLEKSNSPIILKNLLSAVDELLNMCNNFIEELRPEILDSLGLKKSIRHLIDDWSISNPHCEYTLTNTIDDNNVPDAVSQVLYRIAQEALANVAKHSLASSVNVTIQPLTRNNMPFLSMEISDNGIGTGVDHEMLKPGHGLNNMRERAISLGGSFSVKHATPNGTTISIILPLDISL
jgi:signal transduction histidine kinase